MREIDRRWLRAVAFTAGLTALIFLALTKVLDLAVLVMVTAIVGGAGAVFVLFPASRFFGFALANYLAVYTCVFAFFLETNFQPAGRFAIMLSYSLPIVAFLGSVFWRREEIRRLVDIEERRHMPRRLGPMFGWLVPVLLIGCLTFLLPASGGGRPLHDVALIGAMALIAAIVLYVSRDVATFLLDTGLLFEEFFARIARLTVPAFAFFTFYSLIVIVFAAIYRIIDQYSPAVHFRALGQAIKLSFSDSLYFSLVTLSTVGYGDIVPASNLVRVIIGIETVCGVLLLLFGFSEILAYSRERLDRRRDDS
jgi:voltage-gated potassium channel